MREFLLRPLATKVSEIRDENFVALNATDSRQDALNVFRRYDRAALPVVDSGGVVVGIVTSDDMLDVAEEEATEDIQKFGGMEAWMSRTCAFRSGAWCVSAPGGSSFCSWEKC